MLPSHEQDITKCRECGGSGVVTFSDGESGGAPSWTEEECEACGGVGEFRECFDDCAACTAVQEVVDHG